MLTTIGITTTAIAMPLVVSCSSDNKKPTIDPNSLINRINNNL